MRVSNILLIPTVCAGLMGCAHDKNMHFVAGAAASKYVTERTANPMAGCAAALAAGIAKEVYDSRMGGNVEASDAVITAAGCAYTIRF